MKPVKKKISVLLGVLAVLCLFAAGFLLVKQSLASREAEQLLGRMREDAQQPTAENPIEAAGAAPATTTPQDATAEQQQEATESQPPAATEEADENAAVSPVDDPSGGTCSPEEDSGDALPPEPAAMTPEPAPVQTASGNPYQSSFDANSDMAAWLKIDGTNIDYPVMWTPRDENYYLRRGFNGKSDSNGCLILDTDSCMDPLTTNLIIHGHNMRSGKMFGGLSKYESPSYCEDHRYMTLYGKDGYRTYEVCAVFYSQVYYKTDQVFKFYKFFQADTQEEFDDFYTNIKALSLYDTGVTAQFGDHFLTLSTCSYHVENGRFVVVAKETETGAYNTPAE